MNLSVMLSIGLAGLVYCLPWRQVRVNIQPSPTRLLWLVVIGNGRKICSTVYHWAENVPTKTEGKTKEHKHHKTALKTCGYTNWAYVKSTKGSRNNTRRTQEEERKKCRIVVHPYVAEVSERFRRIFSKHITVHYSPLQHHETENSSP